MRIWNMVISITILIAALLTFVSLIAASLGEFANTWGNGYSKSDTRFVQGQSDNTFVPDHRPDDRQYKGAGAVIEIPVLTIAGQESQSSN